MNFGDIEEEYRSEADDNTEPVFCTRDEIARWAWQGEVEIARRSHVIRDSSTPEVCEIAVVAGTATYAIDKRIIAIMRVVDTTNRNRVLNPVKVELMDQFMPNWESRTGSPDRYVKGLDSRRITLYPAPTANTVLRLTVIRMPLGPMVLPSDEPEIEEQHHQGLVQWILHRAYAKKDVEIFDAEKSRVALRTFEAEFGTREDAQAAVEQMQLNQQSWHFNNGYN